MHTSSWPETVEVSPGETGSFSIAITNTSEVINAYHVEVFGLDPSWVESVPATVSLFPGDTQNINVNLRLPEDYPASERIVSVNVVSGDDAEFALNQLGLSVRPRAATSISLDPVLVTAGRSATFGVVVENSGNTPVIATGFATDPEDLAVFTFEPPSVVVAAGRAQVIQVTASGGRNWFGQIRPRTFTFGVDAETRIETLGTFIQRPRIARWMLTLLGLLMAAAVFAIVLSQTFGTVVEQAQVEDGILDAALDAGEVGGAQIPANPSTVTGSVVSSGGDGLSGVQGVLFDADDTTVPLASASTDGAGVFTFSNLGTGNLRLQLSGAGIDTVWYRMGDDGEALVTADAADSTDFLVPEAGETVIGEITVRGTPVVVAGKIDIADPSGVTLQLIIPGENEEGVNPVVAEVQLSADGTFALPDVPSPGDYLLVVQKPGLAPQTQNVSIEPGQKLPPLDIVFNLGRGLITGTVTALGLPLDGATISATDGTSTFQSVSLSGPDPALEGTFTLQNLPVPGRYTVTIDRDGYTSQTRQVSLSSAAEAEADASATGAISETATLPISLVPATGRIEGLVQIAGGGAPDEISIELTGGEIERTTNVTSQDLVTGTYSFSTLPAPQTYTLKFTAPGMIPQVRIVAISPASGVNRAVADLVVLAPRSKTIRGTVVQGTAVGQATVVLSNGAVSRTLQTSDDPADPMGVFTFTNVAPGTYTLSASLPGAVKQVKLIDINASTPQTLDGQNFQLGPQASVVGTVNVFEDRTAPTEDVKVERSVLVRLYLPEQFPQGNPLAETSTDPVTGRFEFAQLSENTYVVAVYESAATSSPLLSKSVTVEPGKQLVMADLKVTLR